MASFLLPSHTAQQRKNERPHPQKRNAATLKRTAATTKTNGRNHKNADFIGADAQISLLPPVVPSFLWWGVGATVGADPRVCP